MNRIKTYKRIAGIQRLQETMAEAELLQARDAVARAESAIHQCIQESGRLLDQSSEALATASTEQWTTCQLAREVLSWRSQVLQMDLTKQREVESAKLDAYTGARIRSEQTTILIRAEQEIAHTADELRAQKNADEFVLRKFATRL